MIEPDSASVAKSIFFSLRTAPGNPRLNFTKYRKSLIQVSVNTSQYHDPFGLAGYVLPAVPWLTLNAGIAALRPTNDRPIFVAGANAATQATYNNEPKEFYKVLNDQALMRENIIFSLPEYIVKTLEDLELGIALVTSLQIVEAAYLELGTVHMNDLEEARNALEAPIEDSFTCQSSWNNAPFLHPIMLPFHPWK